MDLSVRRLVESGIVTTGGGSCYDLSNCLIYLPALRIGHSHAVHRRNKIARPTDNRSDRRCAMSLATTTVIGATGLLGVAMVAEGGLKLAGVHDAEEFAHFGYPQWFHGVVGALELGGGAALLAGLVVGEAIAVAGGTIVTVVLAGAIASHLRVGDSASETAPAATLLVLALVVVAAKLSV